MKSARVLVITITIALAGHLPAARALAGARADARVLAEEQYLDKVKASWLGQIIAVMMGLDFEGKPASVAWVDRFSRTWPHAPVDDDWYYEMEALKAFERFGPGLTVEQLGQIWLEDKVGFAGSSADARKALERGIKAPDCGHPRYNRYWFTMGNQCRGDLFGLLAPGMPNLAARLSRQLGHVNSYAEGTEGGVLLSVMVSLAFFEKDPQTILQQAVQVLDPSSPQRQITEEVIARARRGESPRQISDALARKWRIEYPAFNSAVLNFGMSAIGLWFGEGDYLKTVNIVLAASDYSDADCNAAVAGSVIATIHGTRGLPPGLVAAVRDRIAGDKYNLHPLSSPVDTTVTELSRRTVAMGLRVLEKERIRPENGALRLPQEPIRMQPAERFVPADYMKYWNPDWQLERACHTSVRGGTYLESDEVLATYPREESMGLYLARKLRLSEKPALTVQVAADTGREWKLEVWVDNRRIKEQPVKGVDPRAWQEIRVDLDPFAGKEVTLRLYQLVRTAQPGTAYWRKLQVQ